MKLVQLRGKIVVTTMIFTSCTYACPQIIADLKAIESALSSNTDELVTFLLITMDVARDTPSILKDFAQTMKIDKPNWTLLHGSADDTQEFATLVGINYKRMGDGSFSHSNIISVLNRQGEIAYQQVGLNADPAPTVIKIQDLLKKK